MKRIIIMLFAILLALASAFFAGCAKDDILEEVAIDEASRQESNIEKHEGIDGDGVIATYTTITEAYDWGPAISKIVLDFGQLIDGSNLSPETFTVVSVRRYKGFNFATFTADEEPKDYEAERVVTDVYISDISGNADNAGAFVTIELQVGPNLSEGSPLNYDLVSSLNSYVETSYKISLNDSVMLKDADGVEFSMQETQKEGKAGNVSLIADDFENDVLFSHNGTDLLYASFVPAMASSEADSNSLVIWLHGAGEGGTDTTITIIGNKVVNLATSEIQSLFGDNGTYILAPQSPTMWMDADGTGTYNNSIEGSEGKSYYTVALMALIDDYVANHPEIETDRIYIGGCSNGGYMTVNMITTYPEYFAAAYPVCEAYDVSWITDENIESIKAMPIWFTHAITDGTVAIVEGTLGTDYVTFTPTLDENGNVIMLDNFTNALYERLINAGAENVYYSLFDNVVDTSGLYFKEDGVTPYEYMGHWSWIYTLNNECTENINGAEITLFEWIATQSK